MYSNTNNKKNNLFEIAITVYWLILEYEINNVSFGKINDKIVAHILSLILKTEMIYNVLSIYY